MRCESDTRIGDLPYAVLSHGNDPWLACVADDPAMLHV